MRGRLRSPRGLQLLLCDRARRPLSCQLPTYGLVGSLLRCQLPKCGRVSGPLSCELLLRGVVRSLLGCQLHLQKRTSLLRRLLQVPGLYV